MFLIALFLVCVSLITYSADPTSSRKITLQFQPDSYTNASQQTSIEHNRLHWSTTISTLLEDESNSDVVSLSEITKPTFECLYDLMIEWEKPLKLTSPAASLNDIKSNFALRLGHKKHAMVNSYDRLVSARYLDMHKKFIKVIAFFYAEELHHKKALINTFQFGPNTTNSFDGLPHDLEPYVGGWLVGSLLKNKFKQSIKQKTFKFSPDLLTGPFISTSSPESGFSCIWEELGSSRFLPGGLAQPKLVTVDFSHNEKCKRYTIPLTLDNDTRHTFSADGSHVLIANPTEMTLGFLKKNKSHFEKLALNSFIPCNTIIALLYDTTAQDFILITSEETGKDPLSFLYFSVIDPHAEKPRITLRNKIVVNTLALLRSNDMAWSCINGNLVGIYTAPSGPRALLYTHNKIFECYFDSVEDAWMYENESGKEQVADFVVPPLAIHCDHYNTSIATEHTFIPNFQQILIDKIDEINPIHINALAIRFDPDHLCFNYVNHHQEQNNTGVATTEYLFPPQLISVLQSLNKRILRNDPRILIDIYAVYHYYMNPLNWNNHCGHLYKYITPEISALYPKMGSEQPQHEDSCSLS